MQINGMGSGNHSDIHQITNCIHDHGVSKKESSAAMSSRSAASVTPQTLEQSLEAGFSMGDWVKNMLGRGRNLWGKVWGGEHVKEADAEKESTSKTAIFNDSVVVSLDETKASRGAIGVPPVMHLAENPYFATVQETGKQENLWQRTRVKFHNIAGQMMRRFSFSGRNTFQAKQEKPKEDLTRRSRYRKDDLEIDCVLTDESYLMDSYNRKGEYSTLLSDDSHNQKHVNHF